VPGLWKDRHLARRLQPHDMPMYGELLLHLWQGSRRDKQPLAHEQVPTLWCT
jgi:hypothetical protein